MRQKVSAKYKKSYNKLQGDEVGPEGREVAQAWGNGWCATIMNFELGEKWWVSDAWIDRSRIKDVSRLHGCRLLLSLVRPHSLAVQFCGEQLSFERSRSPKARVMAALTRQDRPHLRLAMRAAARPAFP